jgi:hypothetical protein
MTRNNEKEEFKSLIYINHCRELLEIFNLYCQSENVELESFEVAERAIEVLSRQRITPNLYVIHLNLLNNFKIVFVH